MNAHQSCAHCLQQQLGPPGHGLRWYRWPRQRLPPVLTMSGWSNTSRTSYGDPSWSLLRMPPPSLIGRLQQLHRGKQNMWWLTVVLVRLPIRVPTGNRRLPLWRKPRLRPPNHGVRHLFGGRRTRRRKRRNTKDLPPCTATRLTVQGVQLCCASIVHGGNRRKTMGLPPCTATRLTVQSV